MGNGLGMRLLGAAMVGYGKGAVESGKAKRERALLELRRSWDVEDRDLRMDQAERHHKESMAHRTSLAESALIPAIDPDTGDAVHTPVGEAAGRGVPRKEKTPGSTVTYYDEATGDTFTVRSGSKEENELLNRPGSLIRGKPPLIQDRNRFGEVTGVQSLKEYRDTQAAADAATLKEEAEQSADELIERRTGYFSTDTTDLGASREVFKERLVQAIVSQPNVPVDDLADQVTASLKKHGGSTTAPASGGIPANAPAGAGRDKHGKIWVPVGDQWQQWVPRGQ